MQLDENFVSPNKSIINEMTRTHIYVKEVLTVWTTKEEVLLTFAWATGFSLHPAHEKNSRCNTVCKTGFTLDKQQKKESIINQ